MTRKFLPVLAASIALSSQAFARDLTKSLTINGGQNPSASLRLEQVDEPLQERGVLKLRATLTGLQNLRGYGFVLNYDQSKYEFLDAQEAIDNLLDTENGKPPLFFATGRTPGRIALGGMKVDGRAAEGNGDLVDITFKTLGGSPRPENFQIAEGILVDPEGNLDPLTRLDMDVMEQTLAEYKLNQNVPNPFNPSTTIAYQLPEAGDIRLEIYNLLGQRVRSLVNATMQAGAHKVIWDGRDDVGHGLASGVYLYRLQAGTFRQVHRMLLLK